MKTENTPIYFTLEPMINAIIEFTYNPGDGITFSDCFRRYEHLFREECS